MATAPASAPSAHDTFQLPARVAAALRAPTTDADSHPSQESVATADKINQRFALLIVPTPSRVDTMFIHNAPDPTNAQDHCTHTLLPSHPDFGGSFQEYGAEYPLGTQHLSATHTTKVSQ